MSEHHDNGARESARIIENSWLKEKKWRNKFIDQDIRKVLVPNGFPLADIAFESKKKKTKILLEFKPEKSESKRGIMTGLGQCVGYLNRCHASILVAPNFITDKEGKFNMGVFLTKTFKKFIFGKLPIALFTFDNFDGEKFINLNLKCNIPDNLYANKSNDQFFEARNYWAWWIDWSPDAQFKLLKSASKINGLEKRSERIWDEFYFKYYAIPETLNTLQPVNSNIIGLEDKPMISFETTKKNLLEKVSKNKINNSKAIQLLNLEASKKEKENNYRNLKKNNSIFLKQSHLWDDNQLVTPLGIKYMERVQQCGNDIKKIKDEFAQILLVEGKHAEFIEDIELETNNISKELKINDGEFVKILEDIFYKKGNIHKNPNRIVKKNLKLKAGKSKKFLTKEKQIWNHLNLIKKNGSRYLFKEEGYKFNNERIKILIKKFYENYDEASFKTRKLV